MSHGLFKEHPEVSFLSTRGPWPAGEGQGGSAGQNPARGLTGVWGKVVEKHHGVERNP
jgi:hypothetical protein